MAANTGCVLEGNAPPDRPDLNGACRRMAGDPGVTVAISTDAHRRSDLDDMRFGIGQAGRGRMRRQSVKTIDEKGFQKRIRHKDAKP